MRADTASGGVHGANATTQDALRSAVSIAVKQTGLPCPGLMTVHLFLMATAAPKSRTAEGPCSNVTPSPALAWRAKKTNYSFSNYGKKVGPAPAICCITCCSLQRLLPLGQGIRMPWASTGFNLASLHYRSLWTPT